MKQITEVVAALIWDGDKFMICQRPAHKARGLLWEFVGGKVEPGESREAALIRECQEELGVVLSVGPIFTDVVHTYPDLTVHLTLFHASIASGTPQKIEHNDIRWITPAQIPAYEFCPADVEILKKIADMGEKIAVIDTETTWDNRVMSIGTVIADGCSFQPLEIKYHVLTPEYLTGGMFSHVLFADGRLNPILCNRAEAMEDLISWLHRHGVRRIFAYNAGFDQGHLPELGYLQWYDIMALAAYRQTNPAIPADADCCRTGRLKRGYGVEPMLQLLSGNRCYRETHNALWDAMDELQIMQLLGHGVSDYIPM